MRTLKHEDRGRNQKKVTLIETQQQNEAGQHKTVQAAKTVQIKRSIQPNAVSGQARFNFPRQIEQAMKKSQGVNNPHYSHQAQKEKQICSQQNMHTPSKNNQQRYIGTTGDTVGAIGNKYDPTSKIYEQPSNNQQENNYQISQQRNQKYYKTFVNQVSKINSQRQQQWQGQHDQIGSEHQNSQITIQEMKRTRMENDKNLKILLENSKKLDETLKYNAVQLNQTQTCRSNYGETMQKKSYYQSQAKPQNIKRKYSEERRAKPQKTQMPLHKPERKLINEKQYSGQQEQQNFQDYSQQVPVYNPNIKQPRSNSVRERRPQKDFDRPQVYQYRNGMNRGQQYGHQQGNEGPYVYRQQINPYYSYRSPSRQNYEMMPMNNGMPQSMVIRQIYYVPISQVQQSNPFMPHVFQPINYQPEYFQMRPQFRS